MKHPISNKESHNSSLDTATLISLLEKIEQQQQHIQRRLTVMAIFSYIRLGLFVIPVILGIIYLPPILEKFFHTYGVLFDPSFFEALLRLIEASS